MSQLQPLNFPIDPSIDNGQELAIDVNALADAFLSTSSGPQVPPVTSPGMLWWDTTDPDTFILKILSTSGWINIVAVTVATGVLTYYYNPPVTTVNGLTGAVMIKNLFNASGALAVISSTDSGAIITIPPLAELPGLPPLGGMAIDGATPYIKYFNGTNWDNIGNNEFLAVTMAIVGTQIGLSANLEKNQTYFLNSATPVLMDVLPFGTNNFPVPGSRIVLMGQEGTADITLQNNNAAFGFVSSDGLDFIIGSNGHVELMVNLDNKLIELNRG